MNRICQNSHQKMAGNGAKTQIEFINKLKEL